MLRTFLAEEIASVFSCPLTSLAKLASTAPVSAATQAARATTIHQVLVRATAEYPGLRQSHLHRRGRQPGEQDSIDRALENLRKTQALFFECFPYVCPEPVLVKCSFLHYINGSKSGVFRTT
jgi:hypothetical protein